MFMEKIVVYAIRSLTHNYIYVGQTNNLDRRLSNHNNGFNRSTKAYAPFELIYSEEHDTREKAREREIYFKAGAGKEFLRSL